MNISEAMKICFDSDTIVYPINSGRGFQIEARTGRSKPIRYDKVVKQGLETNKALEKTYIFLAERINSCKLKDITNKK